MGVSNVNSTNSIIKLALAKRGESTRKTNLPDYLKMTGSIFNVKTPTQNRPDDINNLNTLRTLNDFEQHRSPAQTRSTEPDNPQPTSEKPKNKSPEYDTSVSGGKQAMSDANAIGDDVKEQTKDVEKDQKLVDKFADAAAKLDKTTVKNDKKFLNQYKTEQDKVKRDNEKLLKLIKETEEESQVIDDAQNELDQLLAARTRGGDTDTDPATGQPISGNSARIKELQTIIGARVAVVQKNGKSIYSLQRSQSRSLRKMNRAQVQYIKTQNVQKKQIESQQAQTNDVIDIASEVEKYSAIAQSSGQALGLLGKLFVAIGSSTSGFFGIGAALVTIGTVMQKVGTVVELIGQYGQTAASLTKGAAYAAEGNLMGAMMSTASAIASGTAAIKGTSNLKGTFGQINDQAKAATEKIAAKAAAKEAVKGMSEEQLGGMSEKQARKYVQADLQKQMQDGNLTSTAKGVSGKVKDLTQQAKDGFSVKDAQGNIIDANMTSAKSLEKAKQAYKTANEAASRNLNISSFDENTGKYVTNTIKKNGDARTVSKGKLDKLTNKNFSESIEKLGAKKIAFDFNSITTLGNSVTNIATVLSTDSTVKSMSQARKKPVPPAHLTARTQRIMARNQRYKSIRSYAA